MYSDDIEDVIKGYYHWAEVNAPEDIGYPHIDTVRRLRGSGIGSEGLTDEEAMHVNAALCYLKQDRPDVFKVLERIYRDRKTLRWMQHNGEGRRDTLSRLASDGREFVKGALFGAAISS